MIGVHKMKKLLNKLGITDLKSFKAFVMQFIKFGIVGVSNTLIGWAFYYSLIFFGVHYLLANLIGFVIATLNSFYWNRKYVFKQTDGKKSTQLIKVFASYGFTLFLSTTMLFLIVDIIGLSEFIAPLISIIVTVPLNFMLNKFWAFRAPTSNPE